MRLTGAEAAAFIKRTGIIAIVRGNYSLPEILEIGHALRSSSIQVMEVTLNTPGAFAAISALREHLGSDVLVGAGTIRSAEQVDPAIDAGAQFLVSPNFDPLSVARAAARDVLHLPGVFTPSEAQQAAAAGCRMLKLFPSDVLGPSYLKALRAPLDDVEFVPTGGIDAHNIGDYVRAGAVAVAAGSSLVSGPRQPLADVRARAASLRTAWEDAHDG